MRNGNLKFDSEIIPKYKIETEIKIGNRKWKIEIKNWVRIKNQKFKME